MKQLVMMFKGVDSRQLADPGEQLQAVLKFKKEIAEKQTHLFHTFDTLEGFRGILRRHLAAWRRKQVAGPEGGVESPMIPGIGPQTAAAMAPDESEHRESSLTAEAWSLANEERLTEAEAAFAKTAAERSVPETLINYGSFLQRIGRIDQTKVHWERALKVAEDQVDQPVMVAAPGNLGILLQTRGDLDGAEQLFRKSIDAAERLGSSPIVERPNELLASLSMPDAEKPDNE